MIARAEGRTNRETPDRLSDEWPCTLRGRPALPARALGVSRFC